MIITELLGIPYSGIVLAGYENMIQKVYSGGKTDVSLNGRDGHLFVEQFHKFTVLLLHFTSVKDGC